MIKFPHLPETIHPQFLWNEQEYIIRMLNQNKIGVGIDESGNTVIISMQASDSLNFVAWGGGDFPSNEIVYTVNNTKTKRWVYIRATYGTFYEETVKRPIYNQYLHGWYHPDNTDDRAVVFINPDKPQGSRAIIMDSFNSMFEYEQTIPDEPPDEMEPFYELMAIEQWTSSIPLTPGAYLIQLKGGKGGRGGNDITIYSDGTIGGKGGVGGEGQTISYKLVLHEPTTFEGILGGNGANGGAADNDLVLNHSLIGKNHVLGMGGGGGSSGHDTIMKFKNGFELYAMGGVGGGGAAIFAYYENIDEAESKLAGPGGGGAGYQSIENGPENGTIPSPSPNRKTAVGMHGGQTQGGAGGNGWSGGAKGNNGTDREDGISRRNGGDSGSVGNMQASGGNASFSNRFDPLSGYFRIYKIKAF